MIKDIEIERLSENIKRLKAERALRIKKDLENCTKLIKKFKEYDEHILRSLDESSINAYHEKILALKKNLLQQMISSKLNILEKKKNSNSRLTEEQLIEHEMLNANVDYIFKDIEVQADIKKDTKDIGSNAVKSTENALVETDEILEFISEDLESSSNFEENFEENKPFMSIYVTNEKHEEIAAFSHFANKLDDISMIGDHNLDDLEPLEGENKHLKQAANKKTKRKKVFHWRLNKNMETQTDDNIFLEVAKKEEEEIIDWMINDRKNYLVNIKKEILKKKTELSQVHFLMNNSNSFLGVLGESAILDDSKINYSFSSSNPLEDPIDTHVEFLRTQGLINSEVEADSWKHGYYYGYERGKRELTVPPGEIFQQKIQKEQPEETEQPEIEIEQKPVRNWPRNLTLPRKSTKVIEFNFQHKDNKAYGKKTTLKTKLIDQFMQESSKNIIKNAKMSRKMVLKKITSLYSAAITRKKTSDLETLDSLIYDEFCNKYGQKSVVLKKLNDFMSAILKYADCRKIINFAKLLGISKKIGLEDYALPKQSFFFVISFMELIMKSNLGIIINLEDNLDYQFIPAIRAIECSKEILSSYFDNTKIQSIISVIEKNSYPDPKKVNKFGIIDQEFLQELLLLEYDQYNQKMITSLKTILRVLYSAGKIFKIWKQDFIIFARHISPIKFNSLMGGGDLDSFNKFVGCKSSKETMSVNKLINCCLNYGILTTYDIDIYLEYQPTDQDVKDEMQKHLKQNAESLKKVFESKHKYGYSEQYCLVWEQRYKSITEDPISDAKSTLLCWKVLESEINRLLNI
jgi:hypothetical protein